MNKGICCSALGYFILQNHRKWVAMWKVVSAHNRILEITHCFIVLVSLQMNSPGSLSKSSDPPPQSSRPHFALSESEQTEDEEGERGRGHSTSCTEDKHTPLSGQCCLTHPDDVKKDSECLCKSMHYNVSTYTAAGSSHASPGDLAFAQKVGVINLKHPFAGVFFAILSFMTVSSSCSSAQICRGLSVLYWSFSMDSRGADLTKVCVFWVGTLISVIMCHLILTRACHIIAGLTSFQQSVAMDRLQRILGILQKPEMGWASSSQPVYIDLFLLLLQTICFIFFWSLPVFFLQWEISPKPVADWSNAQDVVSSGRTWVNFKSGENS